MDDLVFVERDLQQFVDGLAVAEAITAGTVEAFLGAASGRTRGGDPTADFRFSGVVEVIAASDMDATATAKGVAVSGGSLRQCPPARSTGSN